MLSLTVQKSHLGGEKKVWRKVAIYESIGVKSFSQTDWPAVAVWAPEDMNRLRSWAPMTLLAMALTLSIAPNLHRMYP